MRIVDAAAVRDRLQIKPDAGIDSTIESGIDGAAVHLESVLDTALEAASHVDLFYIDGAYPPRNGFYRLKLSNGFIRPSPAVVVEASESTLYDTLSWTVLAPSTYFVAAEKGFLQVPETHLKSSIRVTYDAGFEDADLAPEWLREVFIVYTIKVLSMHQVSDQKPELKSVYEFVEKHKTNILDRHLRVKNGAIPSVHST